MLDDSRACHIPSCSLMTEKEAVLLSPVSANRISFRQSLSIVSSATLLERQTSEASLTAA